MPAELEELSLIAKGIERRERKEAQLKLLVWRQVRGYGPLPWVPHSGFPGDGVSNHIQSSIHCRLGRMNPGNLVGVHSEEPL